MKYKIGVVLVILTFIFVSLGLLWFGVILLAFSGYTIEILVPFIILFPMWIFIVINSIKSSINKNKNGLLIIMCIIFSIAFFILIDWRLLHLDILLLFIPLVNYWIGLTLILSASKDRYTVG